ncbi:glycoside hydrolase family 76 protein [Streptomyces sp. NPDC005492]|uniref:glycoside hydrolase family 76 protein n=1 Tax=Streptomyces sp. NPDC005492 TaxID=3156883 RepID=UPI0033A44498
MELQPGPGHRCFTELWRTTDDSSLLTTARTLADAAISSPTLTSGGVLTESCDVRPASCDDNQKQFKGIFMRNFADLAKATGSSTYRAYFEKQADTLWASDRSTLNALGERWAGTSPNQTDWRTQAAAHWRRSPPPRAEPQCGCGTPG